MLEMISALQKTPLPTILIFAGILFLILSVSGDIAGKIRVPQERQKFAGIIGFTLLLIGVSLNFPAKHEESSQSSGQNTDSSGTKAVESDSNKKQNLLSQAKEWPLIAEESFIDNKNKWDIGKFEDKSATVYREISNGRYRWQVDLKKNWMGWDKPVFDPARDFLFAVDVKLVNGPRNDIGMGFVFRRTEEDFLYFKISDTQYFELSLNHKGEWIKLIPWTFVKSVKPGLYNRIGVIAQGSKLNLYINEIEVGYIENLTVYNGNIVLTIDGLEKSQAIVDFDNVEFRRPE
jgi:hypothetical protein